MRVIIRLKWPNYCDVGAVGAVPVPFNWYRLLSTVPFRRPPVKRNLSPILHPRVLRVDHYS